MDSTITMINLFGAVALLLFGLAQVKDGVSRAFGARLRTGLATGTRSGLRSFLSGLVATVEALVVAQKFGIEPEIMTDVLNASSGRSNTSETKVKQFMLSGTFGSGFALQLMTKDLNIALSLAKAVEYDMPMGTRSVEIWNKAAAAVSPITDHTEMFRILGEPF